MEPNQYIDRVAEYFTSRNCVAKILSNANSNFVVYMLQI
ncbi:hypothetical protein COO91_04800 [Nostoc flagelliforme CCNUN1]|uniref:Uncharacterized protein n=1 Tax=Nostoc flagelliforme CCNUN1 TaxID=2038116 RepID=A0A2K8SU04_9NOSO|nr:hypothetical protein COO91_04800 [Nostoc flagelliforme CCNUN1]